MSEFSHVNKDNQITMVDVSDKQNSLRVAVAQCMVVLPPNVLEAIQGDEIMAPKGPVFQTAIIAGIQGAKKTSDLIPLCHPLPISGIKIKCDLEGNTVVISCKVRTTGQTGVEMEALTGVNIAALTIYDMCKAMSHDIIIRACQLISKTGGKKDFNREKS